MAPSTRFSSMEDAIEQALAHARRQDHDQVLLCLAYALAQASRARLRADNACVAQAFSNK